MSTILALVKFIPLVSQVIDGFKWVGNKIGAWRKARREAEIHEIDDSSDVSNNL